MKKILVLEDESNIRSFVVINLRRNGYEPIEAENGAMALEQLKVNPDICLALLDVMLPDIDGFEVCRRIRATGSKMGIIMLTAKSQEIDKVTGLMTGADDYVTKPFSPAELTARVDALIRRLGVGEDENSSAEISSGPFLLNTRNRTLEKNGVRINTISQSPTKTTAGQGIGGFDLFFDFADKMSPLGNASADECADYCIMMFSDYTRKVTMQNLYHDGGYSTTGMSQKLIEQYQKSVK